MKGCKPEPIAEHSRWGLNQVYISIASRRAGSTPGNSWSSNKLKKDRKNKKRAAIQAARFS
jgi:hypothetical protein